MSTWTHARGTYQPLEKQGRMTAGSAGCYLVVEVLDLQLVAPSAVGEVEAAVLLREQRSVLALLGDRALVSRALLDPTSVSLKLTRGDGPAHVIHGCCKELCPGSPANVGQEQQEVK